MAFERLRLRIMSRLTEPNFEEIYLLVRDIAARAGEGDAALEETLEAMAVKFRVIQVRLDDARGYHCVNQGLIWATSEWS